MVVTETVNHEQESGRRPFMQLKAGVDPVAAMIVAVSLERKDLFLVAYEVAVAHRLKQVLNSGQEQQTSDATYSVHQ